MKHHKKAKREEEEHIMVSSIFRNQEFSVESENAASVEWRGDWAALSRASALCEAKDGSSAPGRGIATNTSKVTLFSDDSLMPWRPGCSEEGSWADDESDIEVEHLVKSARFVSSPIIQRRPTDIVKIIDTESVELTLDHSNSFAHPVKSKEVIYQEEVRESFDEFIPPLNLCKIAPKSFRNTPSGMRQNQQKQTKDQNISSMSLRYI